MTRAERTLVAETARIGVREADLYPALRLSGSFGGSGLSIGDITETSIGSIAAGLTAPIFQGGRLRAAVEQQQAAAAEALANLPWRFAGRAGGSRERSLRRGRGGTARSRPDHCEAGRRVTRRSIARSQYQAGLIDFQSLLDAERSLLATEDSRATARANRAAAMVQLYKALGGGWGAAAVSASP